MPRLPRIYIEGALYYITCRGAHEQKLFEENRDYNMYLELLKRYKKEFGFKIYAYVLLPSHLHLLIEPGEHATISEIMHVMNSSYSKYFNAEHDRKGHLFRERFRACMVEKGHHLAQVSAYMHLNPKRQGLVENPKDYSFSSLPIYMEDPSGFEEEVDEVLKYTVEETYEQFLQRMINQPHPELHKQLRRGMLGSRGFVEKMNEILNQKEKEIEEKHEEQHEEQAERPLYKKVAPIAVAGFGLVVVGVLASIVYLGKEEPVKALRPAAAIPGPTNRLITIPIHQTEDLDLTEWRIKVTSRTGDVAYPDTLSFINGKFISAHFNEQKLPQTNYSVAEEGEKVVWETMQSMDGLSASWRGEIMDGKMSGIVSLRVGEKTQDFTFTSINYRRK